MIYGPWDVDNDNDGVRDSVWIDAGLPVMIDKQGRLVKPLVAILAVDLDGRLNVNAHGTRELAGLGAGLAVTPPYNPATPLPPQRHRIRDESEPYTSWSGVRTGRNHARTRDRQQVRQSRRRWHVGSSRVGPAATATTSSPAAKTTST